MLMAGSTQRLFISIVLSLLMLSLWGWMATFVTGFGRVTLVFCFAQTLHGIILAVQCVDLGNPMLSAGRNGLVFTNKMASKDLLHWDEVKSLNVFTMHYGLWTIPWMNYLVVRTWRRDYFGGLYWLLPTTWFGCYLIPTRLLAGGGKSARQMVGIIAKLREADRHDGAFDGDPDFMSEKSLRWSMMRNVTFPIGKNGPDEEAMVGAVRDSLLEEAGVHRDLVPEATRQQILASESGRSLAAKGEAWGRQLAAEIELPQAPPPPSRPSFGRKDVLLNGQPLD